MSRLLLVIRGPIDAETLKARWDEASRTSKDLALCYELARGHDGFHDALRAQRAITVALRQACGPAAENVPVFAASEREGERLADYVLAWGATMVCA